MNDMMNANNHIYQQRVIFGSLKGGGDSDV